LLEGDVLDAGQGKSDVAVLVSDLAEIPVQYVEVADVLDAGQGKSDVTDVEMARVVIESLVNLTLMPVVEPDVEVGDLEGNLTKVLVCQLKWMNEEGWKHLCLKERQDVVEAHLEPALKYNDDHLQWLYGEDPMMTHSVALHPLLPKN
jgi:hypothetical protein